MRYLILAATIFLSACASPGGYYAPVYYDPVAIQMINSGMHMMDAGSSPQYFPTYTNCHNTGRFTNCFSH